MDEKPDMRTVKNDAQYAMYTLFFLKPGALVAE